MYSVSEANDYAHELSQNVIRWGKEFINGLKEHEMNLQKKIFKEYHDCYLTGNHQINYNSKVALKCDLLELSINEELKDELINLKEEYWVLPDKGLLAQIFNPTEIEEEPVLQTTWQMTIWKEYVVEYIEPLLNSMILNSINRLMIYANELAEDYNNKLLKMLEHEIQTKEDLVLQLSHEERQLEQDNIWLTDFKEQLIKIEKE